MPRGIRRVTGLTVSALAVALLISGCAPGGGSLSNLSTGSDDSNIQEDTSSRTHDELTSARGIGKPEALSEETLSSDPWATASRAPENSIRQDSNGVHYLADQLLLRTSEDSQPREVLDELAEPGSLKLAGSNAKLHEYRVILPEAHPRKELQRIAQSWERNSSVDTARLIELTPFDPWSSSLNS